MDFIHKPYQLDETIAAIATPPGDGGVAIIRISGKHSLDVADRVVVDAVKSYSSHTAHLGILIDHNGKKIDEALILVMRAPRSYTGEDVVELQCHGGALIAKKVLEAVLAAGARAAAPGEFTFKAFMNGKLDLTQAEAVQRLIGAKNEAALTLASSHLEGALGLLIKDFQKQLTEIAAIFEAWVDFPEEGLEFVSKEELQNRLESVLTGMVHLQETFQDGYRIDHGISVCLAGPPNVGKSSLMNALLRKERAIVTPIAGTTRDLLSEEMTIGRLHVRLTDTAGLRETEEAIEKEGIRRAQEMIQKADLILFLLDATAPKDHSTIDEMPKEKTIFVWNKIDLPHASMCLDVPHEMQISAKEGINLELLKQKISELIWKRDITAKKEEVIITSLRHHEALSNAIKHLQGVLGGIFTENSPEFLISDLRSSLKELGMIIGSDVTEEILTSIFSQFCVGK